MGCAFGTQDQINTHYLLRSHTRTIKIDGRRKSMMLSDQVLQNVKIISKSIQENLQQAEFAKFVLSNHPLFQQLTADQVQSLIKELMLGTTQNNQYVFKAGSTGSSFFIILQGKVQIEIKEKGRQKVEKVLNPGQCFGELSLLFATPRLASVKAISDQLKLLILKGRPFKKNIAEIRQKNISKIKNIIQRTKIFQLLNTKQKMSLINALVQQRYAAGSTIFRENQLATTFYIIQDGIVQITFQDCKIKTLNLGSQQSFGESVFRENGRREGTATAKTDLICYSINGSSMKKCLGQSLKNIIFQNIKKWALSSSPQFQQFEPKQLDYIASNFQNKFARANDIIYSGDKPPDSIFICLEGKINNKKPGTIIYDKQYANYYKTTKTITLQNKEEQQMLLKDDDGIYAKIEFQKLKGIMATLKQKIIKSNLKNRRSLLVNGRSSILSLNNQSKQNKDCDVLKFQELQYLKKLGYGQYGMVYLVKDKKSGTLFALKCQSKFQLKKQEMADCVVAEREILSSICCPFIVGYYSAYQDSKNIYLLLQYIQGKEMFEVMREIGIFNKTTTRYYFGSLVLAIQYLHSLNIVYRDLKPENSLVNFEGKVYLIDLGTAKVLKYQSAFRTGTIIGTPHYMAPEAMQPNKPYSFQADFWSLGVILYEFICGVLPFAQELEEPYQIYKVIKNGKVQFPSFIRDKESINLVKKLLNKNPLDRSAGGFHYIKSSKYFQGFEWDDLEQGKLAVPYIPLQFRNKSITNYDDVEGYPISQFFKQNNSQQNITFKQWTSFDIL